MVALTATWLPSRFWPPCPSSGWARLLGNLPLRPPGAPACRRGVYHLARLELSAHPPRRQQSPAVRGRPYRQGGPGLWLHSFGGGAQQPQGRPVSLPPCFPPVPARRQQRLRSGASGSDLRGGEIPSSSEATRWQPDTSVRLLAQAGTCAAAGAVLTRHHLSDLRGADDPRRPRRHIRTLPRRAAFSHGREPPDGEHQICKEQSCEIGIDSFAAPFFLTGRQARSLPRPIAWPRFLRGGGACRPRRARRLRHRRTLIGPSSSDSAPAIILAACRGPATSQIPADPAAGHVVLSRR